MMRKDISANFLCVPQYKLKRFVTMTTYWVPDLSNIKGFSGHLWHSILIFANKALYKGRRELQSEWSRFEPWLGTWCCVLRQDTLLPQYLSPPRCINRYGKIVGET